MKSQHRHELKTNALAQWLNDFPQWAKKNRALIIYLSIVAVLVAAAYYWKKRQTSVVIPQEQIDFTNIITPLPQNELQILQAQSQGFDTSYNLITLSSNLRSAAQNADNDKMAALGYIEAANVLRTELHYRLETVSQENIITQIEQARNNYNKALEITDDTSLIATAKLGLGLCEEELGNFDTAEQIYHKISEDPELKDTVAAQQAKRRLDVMADFEKEVTFRPPQIPPAKAVQPQTTPPADANDTNMPASSADINLPASPNQ